MFRHIQGKVIDFEDKGIVIKANNIGYLIFVLTKNKESLSLGDEISLYLCYIVRETTQELFGFETKNERKLFELLITISGIGPRTALAILELDSASSLFQAIAENNITYLTQVSGIGKKMAEKIILELKDKIDHLEINDIDNNQNYSEIVEVMQKMGYSKEEIKPIIKELPKDFKTDEAIRFALKMLNQNK